LVDEEMEPRPPSQVSPNSQPSSSPDFSTSTSEDEDAAENVATQQPQSTQWTLPPYPRVCVVHTFMGPSKGKAVKQYTSLDSAPHPVFCCCSSWRLLLCWLWRHIITTMTK
jgi:hypothetical protein